MTYQRRSSPGSESNLTALQEYINYVVLQISTQVCRKKIAFKTIDINDGPLHLDNTLHPI